MSMYQTIYERNIDHLDQVAIKCFITAARLSGSVQQRRRSNDFDRWLLSPVLQSLHFILTLLFGHNTGTYKLSRRWPIAWHCRRICAHGMAIALENWHCHQPWESARKRKNRKWWSNVEWCFPILCAYVQAIIWPYCVCVYVIWWTSVTDHQRVLVDLWKMLCKVTLATGGWPCVHSFAIVRYQPSIYIIMNRHRECRMP